MLLLQSFKFWKPINGHIAKGIIYMKFNHVAIHILTAESLEVHEPQI